MKNSGYEAFSIDNRIKWFEKIVVIKDYYLVIGGGKIGTNFLKYAGKKRFSFVLVIDRDENAPASRGVKVLKTQTELVNLLKNKAAASLPDNKSEPSYGKREK